MKQITKKIVDCEVVKEDVVEPVPPVAYPEKRPSVLSGETYKLRSPHYKEAFYVTINDLHGKPFELFIRTKNKSAEMWINTVTLMASAVFRAVEDPEFIILEMMEVTDTRGSHSNSDHEKFHSSIVAEIGYILSCRMKGIPLKKSKQMLPDEGKTTLQGNEYYDDPCGYEGCEGTIFVKKDNCPECTTCFNSKCG